MLEFFSFSNETTTLICADCLFFSWQQCTVDSTIFLLVLLSIQHIHNGTILWGTRKQKCKEIVFSKRLGSMLKYAQQTKY